MSTSIEVFFSYAHEDEELCKKLEKHLSLLERQGIINTWYDRNINAGSEWGREIDVHLNKAQIILLLVSPDFVASDYCYSVEMKRAMERHERGEARVIPIILRPVHWQDAPFGKLQALPTGAKPVIDPHWYSQDEAFFNVAEGIQNTIKEFTEAKPKGALEASIEVPSHNYAEIAHINETEDFPLMHILKGHSKPALSTRYTESGEHPYSPPSPSRRRGLSTSRMVLLIVLMLLIVGAGGGLYFRAAPPFGHAQPHASPTTQAQQATTTPTAQTPQDLYDQVTQRSPKLNDPLSTNDTNNWTESTSADEKKLSCIFTGGAYHVNVQPRNDVMLCLAQATHFGDLAYRVQMTIVKGEFGGIVFRVDSSQQKYYSFLIDRYGTYRLITSVDNTGEHDYELRKGSSAWFRTGLNQVNLIAVVARGSSIELYINQHYITSASDSTYRAGQIGVFGGNYTQAPTDVVFSHVQVWNV